MFQKSQLEPSSQKPSQPLKLSMEPSNDFWESDRGKGAWCKIHIKPRKRFFAPVGNDCPFGAEEISSKGSLNGKSGKTSKYSDDWQSNPYQRISSKSWVGKTWFYPKAEIDPKTCYSPSRCCQCKEWQKRIAEGWRSCIFNVGGFAQECQRSCCCNVVFSWAANHSDASRKAKTGHQVMFEFCCSPESSLGKVHEEKGIMHFRLTKESNDSSDPEDMNRCKRW